MSEGQRWYDPIGNEFDASFDEDWVENLDQFNRHPAVKAANKQFECFLSNSALMRRKAGRAFPGKTR